MAHQQEMVVPIAIDTKPSRLNKTILIKKTVRVMTGSLNKWGKSIQYSISNETSWMLVSEGAYNWVYITKRDFKDNKLNKHN